MNFVPQNSYQDRSPTIVFSSQTSLVWYPLEDECMKLYSIRDGIQDNYQPSS